MMTTYLRRRSPRHIAVVSGAAFAVALAACGSVSSVDTGAAAPESIAVTAVDYGFEGLPGSIRAGATISLTNDSDSEAHEFVAIRLPDDETRSVDELIQLPPDELAAFFPLVEAVVMAAPGEDGVVVEGTGKPTDPGRYAVICAIPTGADPQAYLAAAAVTDGGPPDVEGGPPHFAVGMYTELIVEG